MSARFKRTVIVLMLSLITIPFIMVTDFFPFMRFGMFAEPIRYSVQQEYFQVVATSGNKEGILKPEQIGMENHFYEYLCRNYFYRGESTLFLQKINTLIPDSVRKYELKRFSENNLTADSIVTYIPE